MQPAADANFKSQISCPSQWERGRLTEQRSARFLALFSLINIKEIDFWPLMSSSKKKANYLIKALKGDLA